MEATSAAIEQLEKHHGSMVKKRIKAAAEWGSLAAIGGSPLLARRASRHTHIECQSSDSPVQEAVTDTGT